MPLAALYPHHMETKQADLKILSKKANEKSADDFLKWLKKNRTKSILGKRLKRPYYKNKGLVIESVSDLKIAQDLCERIVEFSRDTPHLNSDCAFTFGGILNRITKEVFKLENKNSLQFHTYEAFFLERVDEKEAARYVLNILSDLNIPFNDSTSDLYQILFDLDQHYYGMDRLQQRRLLSLTYRDLNLPPFFADDNIFLISKGMMEPITSLTPKEIEFSFGSIIPPYSSLNETPKFRILENWDFLLLDKGEHGFWIYNEKSKLIGTITANPAKALKILLKPSNLREGVCLKNHTGAFETRTSGNKQNKNDTTKVYRQKIRDIFSTSDNKNHEIIHHSGGVSIINPNLKIILITPATT